MTLPDESAKTTRATRIRLGVFRTINIVLVIVMLVFSILYFPVTQWNDYLVMTMQTVDPTDLMFILFWFVPFGIAVLAHSILSSNLALRTNHVGTTWFSPRWKPRYGFKSISIGEAMVMGVIVICNLIWWLVPVYARMTVGRPKNVHDPHMENHAETGRWFWDNLAGFAGWAGMWDAALAIVFIVRENHLTKAVLGNEGGQYHIGVKFHIFAGFMSLFMEVFHGVYYLIAVLIDNALVAKDGVLYPFGYHGTWGITSLVAQCIFSGFSIVTFRRKHFRLFYYIHFLYIIFLLAGFFHFYLAWYPMVGPFLYYVWDRLSASLSIHRSNKIRIRQVSSSVVRVDIPRLSTHAEKYEPGDWVKIQIPKVDPTQWHPFSIASSYEMSPNVLSLFIKTNGPWTHKLHAFAGTAKKSNQKSGEQQQSSSSSSSSSPSYSQSMTVFGRVAGVFGSKSTAYLNSPAMVFVAGGCGVAAVLPFLRKYITVNDPRAKPVFFVWIAQRRSDVIAFRDLLLDLADPDSNMSWVRVHLHLTREATSRHASVIDIESSGEENAQHGTPSQKSVSAPGTSDEEDPKEWDRKGSPVPSTAVATTVMGSANVSTPSLLKFPDTFQLQPYPLAKPTPRARTMIFLKSLRVILALLVFGGGILAYVGARLLVVGYDFDVCWATTAYYMNPLEHFVCFYWYPWGPTLVAIFAAVVLGYAFTLVVNACCNKAVDFESEVRDVPDDCVSEIDTLHFDNRRPDWDAFFKEVDALTPGINEKSGGIGVLAAGPEDLMQSVEERVVNSRKFHFIRESWKT